MLADFMLDIIVGMQQGPIREPVLRSTDSQYLLNGEWHWRVELVELEGNADLNVEKKNLELTQNEYIMMLQENTLLSESTKQRLGNLRSLLVSNSAVIECCYKMIAPCGGQVLALTFAIMNVAPGKQSAVRKH